MRVYKVTTPSGHVQFAGTQGDARKARLAMVERYGTKKMSIEIDEVDIDTKKAGLIAFINTLCARDE